MGGFVFEDSPQTKDEVANGVMDGTEHKLPNIQVSLYQADEKGNVVLDKDGNVLKFVDKGNNNYVLAKDQTVTTGVVTEVVTGANGQLVVKGLDKGEYQFKEVTAPDGYSINETNSSATLTITGDKATAEFTADADMRDTEVGALPETGGIGTTIFTVGGCAIMVAAAALFFMNKKKHEK